MDPLSLFADRSPGERGAGPLLSTKPEERVLSTVRDRDPGMLPAADDPVFASALPGAGDPPVGGPAGEDPLIGPAIFSGPYYPFAGPEGGFIPGTAPLAPPPTGPILSAVPEPATWAVMILGFFAVGAAMRRRGRKRPDLANVR